MLSGREPADRFHLLDQAAAAHGWLLAPHLISGESRSLTGLEANHMEALTQGAALILSVGLSLAISMPVFSLLLLLLANGVRHSRDTRYT